MENITILKEILFIKNAKNGEKYIEIQIVRRY